jgi:hypothetical protein
MRNREARQHVDMAPGPKARVVFEPGGVELGSRLGQSPIPCRAKRSLAKQLDAAAVARELTFQQHIADLPGYTSGNPERIVLSSPGSDRREAVGRRS